MKPTASFGIAFVILLLCIGRFLFFFDAYQHDPALIVDPDSKSYTDTAEALYESGRFDNAHGQPETWRTPGYPAYLAGVRMLFPSNYLFAAVVIQHFAFFATMIMVAFLAHRLGGILALAIAVALLLTDFTTFYFVNELLPETIYTSLVTLTVLLIYLSYRSIDHALAWTAAVGTVIAIATFVRPSSLYFIYLLAGITFWYFRSRTSDNRFAGRAVAVLLVPWFVIVGIWYTRNYLVAGAFAFATIEDEILYHHALYMIKTMQGVDLDGARAWVAETFPSGLRSTSALVRFFLDHPLAYLYESVMGVARTLLSPSQWYLQQYLMLFADLFPLEPMLFARDWAGIGAELARRPIAYLPTVVGVFSHAFILTAGAVLAIAFVGSAAPVNRGVILAAFAWIAYFLAMVAVFHGASRYRVSFTPLLAILGGFGFARLIAMKGPVELRAVERNSTS